MWKSLCYVTGVASTSFQMCDGSSGLLIRQKGWGVTSEIKLQKSDFGFAGILLLLTLIKPAAIL